MSVPLPETLDIDAPGAYASERRAFGKPLEDQGMIRQIIADMGVDLEAARHLCLGASLADDAHLPGAMEKTLMAKYFASRAAARAAADTVQVMGAAGCHEDNPAARYYRDAKLYEIGAGTSEIRRLVIADEIIRRGSGFA